MKYILFVIVLISTYIMSCSNKNISIPKDALLVDVRTQEEFSIESVPDAINIPLSTIENNIDKFRGHNSIVLFCRSGNRSGKAKKILDAQGFENVSNGGSWKEVLEILRQDQKAKAQ